MVLKPCCLRLPLSAATLDVPFDVELVLLVCCSDIFFLSFCSDATKRDSLGNCNKKIGIGNTAKKKKCYCCFRKTRLQTDEIIKMLFKVSICFI
jgi:hypothetical protein